MWGEDTLRQPWCEDFSSILDSSGVSESPV
jgi:hypothetical protein